MRKQQGIAASITGGILGANTARSITATIDRIGFPGGFAQEDSILEPGMSGSGMSGSGIESTEAGTELTEAGTGGSDDVITITPPTVALVAGVVIIIAIPITVLVTAIVIGVPLTRACPQSENHI